MQGRLLWVPSLRQPMRNRRHCGACPLDACFRNLPGRAPVQFFLRKSMNLCYDR